ncbi:MAG TPA: DUF3037 domain-containing protein [Verrucomicrobiae bacterium]|jgi:hypothetical protein|nr:DUF3037 domain-containing protein [Verrucomicrobiae bacterium]
MNELVCNFAVARFLPYRETAEFVNLGVVISCPQTGYFDFLFETRKHKRVTDFFPELDLEVLKTGMRALHLELGRLRMEDKSGRVTPLLFNDAIKEGQQSFRELVRVRESMFCFGEIGTTIAGDPGEKLKQLFAYYVKRQFAQDREYQEIIMRDQLADFLRRQRLAHFYHPRVVGDEDYHVALPFVYEREGRAMKAIKPLHLDKKEPTEIYRHGDSWISTTRRLRKANKLPEKFLFTVKSPKTDAKRMTAAKAVCEELGKLEVFVTPFGEQIHILDFARIN